MATPKKTKVAKKNKIIATGASWDFNKIEEAYNVIEKIAIEKYDLDFYPNQIEIITAEQMLDAYSSVAMPVMYNHWSFGKQFVRESEAYKRGHMGLAFEVVINSNPCIAYLMEENTMAMQLLVIAHASIGHNAFFKNNYMFKQWTDASSIIDYLSFAKKYVAECEEKHGHAEVEKILDSCHALMNYGVFRYKRPKPLSVHEEKELQRERIRYQQQMYNDLWETTIPKGRDTFGVSIERFPSEPEENILDFIEHNAPHLESWKRELIRIVKNVAQYFYPQMHTKVSNEGFATFIHYTIMNDLYDEGFIDEGYMLEFLQSHTSVVKQTSFDSKFYSGINPYALGFAIYQDIRRICTNPTDEDREWFPDFAGNNDWVEIVKWAMSDFKDDSFIQQFLSPKVMRDLKLFSVLDDEEDDELEISAIHNTNGYKKVRAALANQYNISSMLPNIQVYNVNVRGDRALTLRHYQNNKRPLHPESTLETMKHILQLWEYPVVLESVNPNKDYSKTRESWEAQFYVDEEKSSSKFS